MTNKGTRGVKFEVPIESEVCVESGISVVISTKIHCISCMKEYMDKSLEELRWEDYVATKNEPQQTNGRLFGFNSSTISRPLFSLTDNILPGNSNTTGFNGSKSPFNRARLFETGSNSSPFSNTNSSGSVGKPCPNVFGSSTQCKPFGASVFGFTDNGGKFMNTEQAESKPASSNTKVFGFSNNKPCFGNFNTFTETQSSAFKTISSFNKVDSSPPFGIKTFLFNCPSKTNGSSSSSSGSALRNIRVPSKPRNFSDQKISVSSYTSNGAKSSHDAQEAVKFGGIEKFDFSFNNSSKLGNQKESVLQNLVPENHEEEIKTLIFDLQGLIECPVCFARLDSSLKQCENGHGICSTCSSNVEKCPTCQHAYLPQKPTLLGQILDRLPKPCKFDDNGCKKICFSQKEEHETFCKFRSTSCKFQSCEWKGTVETVADHVRMCERGSEYSLSEIYFPNVKVSKVYKFEKTQDANLYSAIIFENQLFWKHFHRDNSSKMISYKFLHITPSKPKQNYYLVVCFNKGDIEFKMCVKSSYETKHFEDKANGVSFFLSDEDLERFYDSVAEGYRYTQYIVVENIYDKNKS